METGKEAEVVAVKASSTGNDETVTPAGSSGPSTPKPLTEADLKNSIKPCLMGYVKAKLFRKAYQKSDEEPIADCVVIVTGANKGLGKAIVLEMATRGATVVLACRDLVSGQSTLHEIKGSTKNENLVLMKLDVSDLNSVRAFASEAKTKFPKVKLLINNAGILDKLKPTDKTAAGFNKSIATNYLGPFLLTNLLLDNLKAAAPSRVVSISSGVQLCARLDLDDLQMERVTDYGYLNYLPYANSKLLMSIFMRELGKRLANSGTSTYVLCPGLMSTDMAAPTDGSAPTFSTKLFMKLFAYSPQQACDTVLMCSLGKSTASETGKMYQNRGIPLNLNQQLIDNDEVGVKLWDISSKLVGLPS